MSDDIQAPSEASAEVQEILKELQEEGETLAVEEPKTEEPVKTEEVAPEKEEPIPVKEEPKRIEKFVPVSKHNEERHKRQEAERRAEEAAKKAEELEMKLRESANKPAKEEQDDIRSVSKKLAEKHGLDEEFISEFAEEMAAIAAKRNVLPKELEQKLATFEQMKVQAETAALEAAQEAGFQSEFAEVVKEFPELADRKEDLKQLAFSEGNINTSLRRIALEYVHDNAPTKPGRKSAESPTNFKKDSPDAVDFANMTEEQFAGLSDEQHDLFLKWIDNKKRR